MLIPFKSDKMEFIERSMSRNVNVYRVRYHYHHIFEEKAIRITNAINRVSA